MFTGLVQGTGALRAVQARAGQSRLTLAPDFPVADCRRGESIAVNGACLSVEEFGADWFSVYASAETLAHTTLGSLRPGARVNLERALALGDRLGGHLVSGHVDCVARVESVAPAGESKIFRLSFPAGLGELVVPKGSVCLDGVSLTVNECGPDWLTVNIIPETQAATTISSWKSGALVNMETDLLGKYVQRMLAAWRNAGGGREAKPSGLSEDFLRRHGF
ncbi:MAG: riboflavin synthase [Thermodesulfobacteriota bacterium]